MVNRSSSKSVDLQELITGVAKLELKTLKAGMECWQVWISQVAKLSNIANDTLEAIQDDKASLSDAAHRLTKFGKENADVVRDLSSRLSKTYFDELERLTATFNPRGDKPARIKKNAQRSSTKIAATARKAASKVVLRKKAQRSSTKTTRAAKK